MNRIATPSLLALALLAAPAAHALTAVPSAENSTVPSCFNPCPLGDVPFTVIVRDLANNPVGGSFVEFKFADCTNAFICTPLPTDDYTIDLVNHTLRDTTNALGAVTIHPRVGGTGAVGCVDLFANGVLLKHYALSSPDQTGDGVVVAADAMVLNAKLGTSDPTGDVDCIPGPVDANDVTALNQHANHTCFGVGDAVKRGSWGSVKLHYR